MSVPEGAPIWIDLHSSDPAASIRFYTELFGWTAEDKSSVEDYTYFRSGGARVGGVLAPADDKTPGDAWSVDLRVGDATAVLTAASAHGGTVLYGPEAVGDLGTMGGMTDPSGAFVSVWQPGTLAGLELEDQPGAPCWYELHTKDFAAAVPFYESVFGWETSSMGDTDQFRMVTFGAGPDAYAGIYDAALNDMTPSSTWIVYFAVADADATAARIVELGGSLFDKVGNTPFGRMAHAADSQGALFTFVQLPN